MADRTASPSLAAPLLTCAEGRMPPNVALMQLLTAAPDETAARNALRVAELHVASEQALRRIHEIQQHWDEQSNAFRCVKEITSAAALSSGERADWAATFDEVARISPEAAVALYSLGNPALLTAATGELVNHLHTWGLLSPEFCVLDLGCGFGRVTQAIASDVCQVVALEVSKRMVELARTALHGLENVLVVRSDGNGLSFLPDASFDVALAIDSFPYLVDRGLAERHMADAARVLKPAGRLLIMNYSYRGNLVLDQTDVGQLAQDHGFAVERNGTSDLSLWDGRAFLLRRI